LYASKSATRHYDRQNHGGQHIFRKFLSYQFPFSRKNQSTLDACPQDGKGIRFSRSLLGPGCTIIPVRDPSFNLVANVLYFFADRIADILSTGGGQQKASAHPDSNSGGEYKHIPERVIFLREDSGSGFIRNLGRTIRCAVHLLGGLVHDVNGGFQY
jgi:hypothetical protein